MAGLFALSVDPTKYPNRFLEDLFWGIFYQQHLSADYCGISTFDNEKIRIQTHKGLLRPSFEGEMTEFEGSQGIGYCGSDREPRLVTSRVGRWSACFSGNLTNREELKKRFMDFGHIFEQTAEDINDIEIIVKLLAQGKDIVNGIETIVQEAEGAYSLFVLTEDGIFIVRSPNGQWPLVIGEKEGSVCVASESGGFRNLGFELKRALAPGEIVFLSNGILNPIKVIKAKETKVCSFLWVYTTFPNAVIEGIPASLVRKRLGAALARRDIKKGFCPDIVSPVPDSGRFHAIGYHQEFCRQIMAGNTDKMPFYDEVLLKYSYAGRSYTPQTQEARELEAHIKLLTSGEDFSGTTLVVCDDSIVRGTQTQTNLVPKLKSMGIEDIHFRISNPELVSHCPWGKTTKKGETLVHRVPDIGERVKFLGVESLKYNTVDDLVNAIGLQREQLCVDCDLPCEQ